MTITIPDTTLCAMVRNEMVNPAGGIRRFVRSHVPYFPEAHLLDTGSTDGTYEALLELQQEYPHMRVYRRDFDGFAPSRNFQISKVRTRRMCISDADELISIEGLGRLRGLLEEYPEERAWNFDFIDVLPGGKTRPGLGHNPRLFDVATGAFYRHARPNWDERLIMPEGGPHGTPLEKYAYDSGISILHFMPDLVGRKVKEDMWYGLLQSCPEGAIPAVLPMCGQVPIWKAYNPQREKYY